MDSWLFEFLKGIGRFFLHPLFYFFIFITLVVGYNRVKRERKFFHVRIFDSISELKYMSSRGVFLGLILSLIMIGAGVVIPTGALAIITIVSLVLGLTFRLRWLSPAYVLGLTLLLSITLPGLSTGVVWIDSMLAELTSIHPTALSLLLGLLLIVEGILISKDGSRISSPRFETSKRGRLIGSHVSNRLWMLPIFVLLPGEAVSSVFPWWPLQY